MVEGRGSPLKRGRDDILTSRRNIWVGAALALALVAGVPAAKLVTKMEDEDGSVTYIYDDDSWVTKNAAGDIIDASGPVTADGVVDNGGGGVEEGEAPGDEPGYDGLNGEPEPVAQCTSAPEPCEKNRFQQKGSKFFYLNHCPGDCGSEAFERVSEVIDDAWIHVSGRFGSLYDTRKMSGYIYTTHGSYQENGAMAWAGGHFDPRKQEIHVPAPLGRRGYRLKELLSHELTHYMLYKRTYNEEHDRSMIGRMKWLNEGLAQRVEESLFENESDRVGRGQRMQSLIALQRAFRAGKSFMPLHSMLIRYRDVSLFYPQSWAMVAYIEGRYGNRAIDGMLGYLKNTNIRLRVYRKKQAVHPSMTKFLGDALAAGNLPDAETLVAAAEAWARNEIRKEARR